MKQGRGMNSMSATKVEPKATAKSVPKVADMGLQVVRTRPYQDPGRGFNAPSPVATTCHKGGSQGKH
jgi:hypothetical protein